MGMELMLRAAQTGLALRELERLNEVSERYGLTLSQPQMEELIARRFEALESTGRVELGEGVTGKLVFAFCDSPYIQGSEWLSTLCALQDDFYAFKSDAEGALSDDELIDCMKRVFDGRAGGSLDALENISVGELYRAARGDGSDDEEIGE